MSAAISVCYFDRIVPLPADHIEGIGDLSKQVVRNPAFEPRRHAGLGPGHYELWNRIGERTSVGELIQKSTLGRDQAVAFLRQLLLLNAVGLGDALPDDDFEIVDPSELGQITDAERKLLEEEVELEPWERRRILGAARMLQRGDYHELLGIRTDSTRRELKRAYYQLSKEFHPDRYYGKKLGSYGALLSHIFENAAETVQKMVARSVGPAGPRRRICDRYAFPIKMQLQCSSWAGPVQLVTQDISERGLFVVTTESATRGDRIQASIAIKRGEPLMLTGRVATSRTPELAWRSGRRPGLGIELDPVEDERFTRILDAARRSAELPIAHPSETEKEAVPQKPRLARGTGSHQAVPIVLGIDFGTTNSSISVAMGGKVRLIPWSDGAVSAPSVVAFPTAHETLVGEAARKRLPTDPTHTIASVKRLVGVPFRDRNIQGLIGQAPYRTSQAPDGGVSVEMWGDQYAVAQIAGMVLRAARETAESHLGQAVEKVVLTVPVSFDSQRLASLRRAAELARLQVISVIDEPTAAAMANRRDPRFQGLVGVYDFGGGTFDFSVVNTSAGDVRVLATSGDSWLGGDDFDSAIANAVANQNLAPPRHRPANARCRVAAVVVRLRAHQAAAVGGRRARRVGDSGCAAHGRRRARSAHPPRPPHLRASVDAAGRALARDRGPGPASSRCRPGAAVGDLPVRRNGVYPAGAPDAARSPARPGAVRRAARVRGLPRRQRARGQHRPEPVALGRRRQLSRALPNATGRKVEAPVAPARCRR